MGTFLVTGIQGLIGAHVAGELVKRGHGVVGLDASAEGELDHYPDAKIVTKVGDATDVGLVEAIVAEHRVSGIVHLAGLRNEVVYRDRPRVLFDANLGGAQAVLEAARKRGTRRVVFASTGAVYGPTDPATSIPEEAPLNPRGVYATSKVMCESLLRCYSGLYGIEGVAIRCSRVWGRLAKLDTLEFGNPLSSLVTRAAAGIAIDEPSGADFSGDFSYAPDVARGFVDALLHRTPGPVYNIGPGAAYRLSQVCEVLRGMFPRTPIVLGPGTSPYDSQSPSRGPLDIGKAERELAYKPAFTLEAALRDFEIRATSAKLGQKTPVPGMA